tara:strand:+ start:224 stop:565 length:342 start_codon:yes stop_codon:yes gene_type:complete
MPGRSKKGGGLEVKSAYKKQKFGEARSPFTMKGSPMQRNFGIGSPVKDYGHDPEKPEGHEHSKEDPATMTGIIGGENEDLVIDESGNWVKQSKRPDLVEKKEEVKAPPAQKKD